MRVPDQTVDAVRAATNIVEVIGEHLSLVPAGRNYKALCPFHEEKTPSFIVTPDRQTYHCFGCGAGGNAFTFMMKYEGFGFREALELLAARAGIALPRAAPDRRDAMGGGGGVAGGGPGDEGSAGRLLAVLEEATRLYERNLWELEAGARARAYLAERGIREETARAARLGYALPGFDHLRQRLGRSHGMGILIAAGLLVDRGEDRNYDRFRDRLVFPIVGPAGRPLGFGARSLDDSQPKYLNSPETAVYHKREVLYGLPAARRFWAREGTAWIVEGYMDVLALHQAGMGWVVAVSGTALTEHHARLLARHVKRVALLFDGDEAGRGAVLRSLPALLEHGLGIKVALFPGGEDPDSLVRKGGREAVEEVVGQAAGVIGFILSTCRESLPPPEARAEALRQAVQLGVLLPDRVGRRLFAEEAGRRLGFDEATLAREIEASRGARKVPRPRASSTAPGAASERAGGTSARLPPAGRGEGASGQAAERMLLAMALGRPLLVRRIRDELSPEDFTLPDHRRLIDLLLEREERGESIRAADLAGPNNEDAALAELVSALAVDPTADEGEEEAASDLVAKLRERRRRREVARLRERIRECEAQGRQSEVGSLLAEMQVILQSASRGSPGDP